MFPKTTLRRINILEESIFKAQERAGIHNSSMLVCAVSKKSLLDLGIKCKTVLGVMNIVDNENNSIFETTHFWIQLVDSPLPKSMFDATIISLEDNKNNKGHRRDESWQYKELTKEVILKRQNNGFLPNDIELFECDVEEFLDIGRSAYHHVDYFCKLVDEAVQSIIDLLPLSDESEQILNELFKQNKIREQELLLEKYNLSILPSIASTTPLVPEPDEVSEILNTLQYKDDSYINDEDDTRSRDESSSCSELSYNNDDIHDEDIITLEHEKFAEMLLNTQ